MSERDLWAALRAACHTAGHFCRIESMTGVGIPDVTYCVRGYAGWIELKHVPVWPALPTTVVPVPHYSAAQRVWARTRLNAGGTVWVLMQVHRTYLLLPGDWAVAHLGVTATAGDLHRAARVTGEGRFPGAALLGALVGGDPGLRKGVGVRTGSDAS